MEHLTETDFSPGAALVACLACPACGGPLLHLPDSLSCRQCAVSWQTADGVPQFVSSFPYWGEIPYEQMIELNRKAAAGNWRKALLEFEDPVVKEASTMILNLGRAKWHWLLDLPPQSRVLDVGAGMGTTSHALALQYAEVVAAEPVLERTQFMRYRFSQEHLPNIMVVRAAIWELPFAPETFDLAVMNGVLEWVAEGRPGDPGELQEEALRRMYRLLRPGGWLYVGIENRLMIEYLLGYPDPHCGLPFVTMLPRPLAQWYAKRRGSANGYRNYLYSSRGYRRLLRKAGFQDVDIYAAVPSYNNPQFYLPQSDNVLRFYFRVFRPGRRRTARGIAKDVLIRSGLEGYLQYSYAILARKPLRGEAA